MNKNTDLLLVTNMILYHNIVVKHACSGPNQSGGVAYHSKSLSTNQIVGFVLVYLRI